MTADGRYQPMIRDLPQGERPRERLKAYGAKLLNNTELIAILLRTGMQGENVLAVSSRLLAQFDGLAGLGRTTFAELCAQRGLSEAKACQLLAALELGRRFVSLAPEERMVINSPQDVVNLVQAEMAVFDQEHLRVLLLLSRNPEGGFPRGGPQGHETRWSFAVQQAQKPDSGAVGLRRRHWRRCPFAHRLLSADFICERSNATNARTCEAMSGS